MYNRITVFIFVLFTLNAHLFAGGMSDDEIKIDNNEWILCIANFETASLPENRLGVSDVIMRKLIEYINMISYRARISPEYAFYEGAAWARARSEAAGAIAAKQNERSMLVYRGDPNWRYRRNVRRTDSDLKNLRLNLEEVENNAPLINIEPVFSLTDDNLENNFPDPPIPGNEYRFCLDQKADAVLTGSIIYFHERFIVSWKLYTIYTQSVIWEDNIIFSPDDIDNAMEEITRRLFSVLSGSENAVLTVRAEPADTLVLINRAFAGRGGTQRLEYPPGTIIITASAPHHESLTFDVDLSSSEHTDIQIALLPIEYGDVEITGLEGKVYHGSLYVGEAPLTIRLPLNQFEYFELETSDNALSTAAFRTLNESDFSFSLTMPSALGQRNGLVERSRRNFYWSWGGAWITGIAAWLSYYSYSSSNMAISANYYRTGEYNQKFYDDNMRMYYISMGTVIAFGVTALIDVFFMSRYIINSGKGTTSVIRINGY